MVDEGVRRHVRLIDGAFVIGMGLIIAMATLAASTPPAGAGAGAPVFPAPSGFSGGGGVSVSCTGPTACTSVGTAGSASTEADGAWGSPVQLSAATLRP